MRREMIWADTIGCTAWRYDFTPSLGFTQVYTHPPTGPATTRREG